MVVDPGYVTLSVLGPTDRYSPFDPAGAMEDTDDLTLFKNFALRGNRRSSFGWRLSNFQHRVGRPGTGDINLTLDTDAIAASITCPTGRRLRGRRVRIRTPDTRSPTTRTRTSAESCEATYGRSNWCSGRLLRKPRVAARVVNQSATRHLPAWRVAVRPGHPPMAWIPVCRWTRRARGRAPLTYSRRANARHRTGTAGGTVPSDPVLASGDWRHRWNRPPRPVFRPS